MAKLRLNNPLLKYDGAKGYSLPTCHYIFFINEIAFSFGKRKIIEAYIFFMIDLKFIRQGTVKISSRHCQRYRVGYTKLLKLLHQVSKNESSEFSNFLCLMLCGGRCLFLCKGRCLMLWGRACLT